MATKRGNPISLDVVGSVEADVSTQVKDLHLRVESAERARNNWLDKQYRLLKQRRGITGPKSVPWPGANNDSWPLTDAVARRWKPAIISLVLDSEPVTHFFARNPERVEPAREAQNYYHWLFTESIKNSALTLAELADSVFQYGIGYTRQGWDWRTDRQARIARVESLFPGDLEQALAQVNTEIAEINANLPEGQPERPQMTPEELIMTTLEQEYRLSRANPVEAEQLQQAAREILGGKGYVRLVYEDVVTDCPSWKFISPLDVVEPPRNEDTQNADYICIVHRMSAEEVLRMAKDGFFRQVEADEVAKKIRGKAQFPEDTEKFGGRSTGKQRQLVDLLNEAEGIDDIYESEVPRTVIWEIYTKIDFNGDKINERVILWYHPDSKTILAMMEYPYPFREWPIVKFNFELTNKRPYGPRGGAEMLSTFQKVMNRMHNARLDAAQITLSPMFEVRAVGNNFSRNVPFRPGGRIPVQQVGDFRPIEMDLRPLTEFFREEQFTKALAEQYIGVFDASLTQLGGTGRERRTATEVEAVVSQLSSVFALDAKLFQLSMAQVHQQLWKLWVDFGAEECFYRVTGEEQPKTVRKGEIAFEYDIVPAGAPVNTNKTIMLNRAREMIQLFLATQVPWINYRELIKNYFDVMDPQLSKRIVLDENDVMLQLKSQLAQISAEIGEGNGRQRLML